MPLNQLLTKMSADDSIEVLPNQLNLFD